METPGPALRWIRLLDRARERIRYCVTACVPSNSRAVLLDNVFCHVNQAPVKPARFNPRITVGTLRMAFQRIPVL